MSGITTSTCSHRTPSLGSALGQTDALELSHLSLGLLAKEKTICQCVHDPLIVSVDAESHCKDHAQITALGVTVLDTRDILYDRRGNRVKLDEARCLLASETTHFRIVENNRKKGKGEDRAGDPLEANEDFLFGRDVWVTKAEFGDALMKLLRRPRKGPVDLVNDFPALGADSRPTNSGSSIPAIASFASSKNMRALSAAAEAPSLVQDAEAASQYRPVVFGGHAYDNEDRYMAKMGFNMADVGCIVGIVDTQSMMSGFDQKSKPGLTALATDALGSHPLKRHNGGNDTVYTLAVWVKCVFEEARAKGYLPARSPRAKTIGQAVKEMMAQAQIRERFMAADEHCKSCGAEDHKTSEHEALFTCTWCLEKGRPHTGHNTSTCQRCQVCYAWGHKFCCGKCKQAGHDLEQCPEYGRLRRPQQCGNVQAKKGNQQSINATAAAVSMEGLVFTTKGGSQRDRKRAAKEAKEAKGL